MLMRDKVAIVTGAAHGIGKGIALLFAAEGARIFLLDRDQSANEDVAAFLRAKGHFARAIFGDACTPESAREIASAALDEFRRIDVLVNNVGVYPRRSFLEMSESEWDDVQEVNLKSVFHCTQAVLPHMVERGAGKIINVSSVSFRIGSKRMAHYSAAKGGIVGLTRSLAREFGPSNVYVNCIEPGAILVEKESDTLTPEKTASVVAQQSITRLLLPIDVARVCLFLACELSDGMTGQTLAVNGGWMMH